MSLNINAPLLKIISSLVVTIPVSNLSGRQKKTLVGFALSGLIVGNGVPAQLACHLRKSHDLGYIKRIKNSTWTTWVNLQSDEMDEIAAAAIATRLTDNVGVYHQRFVDSAIAKEKSGHFYSSHYTDEMFSNTKLKLTDKLGAWCCDLMAGEIADIVYSPLTK